MCARLCMLEDYFFTKNTRWELWSTLGAVVVLFIFHAGVVTGQHQPTRGHVPKGPDEHGQGGVLDNFLPRQGYVENDHGAVGTIATVTLPTFILQSRDGLAQKIYV